MLHTMICRSFAATGLLLLAGCAQEPGSHPSYIGLVDLAGGTAANAETPPARDVPEALRHVQSNKVLGAMAFQRVTGRTVDPSSLSGAAARAP